MLVIYMERDVAEWTLRLLQKLGFADKQSEQAEMALIAAIGQASIARNDGLNAATDAEAAASIK